MPVSENAFVEVIVLADDIQSNPWLAGVVSLELFQPTPWLLLLFQWTLLPSAEVLIPLPPQLTSELEPPLQFTFVTAGTGAPVDTGEELNRSDNAEYLSPPVRLGTDTGCWDVDPFVKDEETATVLLIGTNVSEKENK